MWKMFQNILVQLLLLTNLFLIVCASTFGTFLLAHTINPDDPHTSNFKEWNGESWNLWLHDREQLHQRENNFHGQLLTRKGINSVIVGAPEEIIESFAYSEPGYNGMTWSNKRFHTYVFLNPRHRVLDCGLLYLSARLVQGEPVHFHKSSDSQQDFGNNNNFSFRNCKPIY